MTNPTPKSKDALATWLVDIAGNIAVSSEGVGLLARIKNLAVPVFASTEQAVEWGSHLNSQEHATLVDIQRTSSNAAQRECNLQRKLDLGTQSQLMREAAEASFQAS